MGPCRPSAEGLAATPPRARAARPAGRAVRPHRELRGGHPDLLRDVAESRPRAGLARALHHRDDDRADAGRRGGGPSAGRVASSAQGHELDQSFAGAYAAPRTRPAAAVADAGSATTPSSAPPTPGSGRGCAACGRRDSYRGQEGGIVRAPASTTPLLRLPVGWHVLRALGAAPASLLARLAGVGAPWVHLHSSTPGGGGAPTVAGRASARLGHWSGVGGEPPAPARTPGVAALPSERGLGSRRVARDRADSA